MFFMSNGFQFIPESLFETGFGISKSSDFAIFYIFSIFTISIFRYKDFLVKDGITRAIWIFMSFVLVNMAVSYFKYSVSIVDIIKTTRIYFYVLSYFIFRRLSVEELKQILNIAFVITLIGATLYVVQAIIGKPLLAGSAWTGTFGEINRYYNIPILYYCFIIYAIFSNPLRGGLKYFSIVIFLLVAIVSLHRGVMAAIFIVSFVGIFIKEGSLKGAFKYLLVGGLCLAPILDTILDRFGNDRTTEDINSVMGGAFVDYSNEVGANSTFLFRIALFYERLDYVLEEPIRMVFGVGYMTEESSHSDPNFNFIVGLPDDDGQIAQLETSDMAWPNFILRLGFVGTFIFMNLYYVLWRKFYEGKDDPFVLSFLLYILLLLITSMSSVELYYTQMIVPVMMVYVIQNNKANFKLETDE